MKANRAGNVTSVSGTTATMSWTWGRVVSVILWVVAAIASALTFVGRCHRSDTIRRPLLCLCNLLDLQLAVFCWH